MSSSTPPFNPAPTHPLFSRGALYEELVGETATRLAFAALSHLPLSTYGADTHILDSACGPGIVTKLLLSPTPAYLSSTTGTDSSAAKLPIVPPPRVTGLDNSEDMVARYNSNASTLGWGEKVTAHVQDAQDLSERFADGVLDAAIMSLGIFGVSDAVACISEMRRALKPGGYVVLTTWKIRRPQEIIGRAAAVIRPGDESPLDIDAKWLTAEHLEKVVTEAGFKKEETAMHEFAPDWRLGSLEAEIEGLSSPVFTAQIFNRGKWDDEEKGRWRHEVEKQLTEEEKTTGTLSMVAHICVARKEV